MTIRLLAVVDVDGLLDYLIPHFAQSGRDGEPVYAPYPQDYSFPAGEMRARFRAAWGRVLTEPGWKRGWGAFDGDRIVGHAMLHGGQLEAEMHRAKLGMGVDRDYRRQGIATQLMHAAIAWARQAPEIAWIDLGVFSGNSAARTLYEKLGFRQTGVIRDRFRIDGRSIDDVQMTLPVSG